jgi:CTP:molybdopterin cytidylyltransferase MocA
MGRPKALLRLPDGRSLLRAWLDLVPGGVVAAGAVVEPLRAELEPGEALVVNPEWQRTGPLESLICALSLQSAPRVVVTPVDAVPCSAQTLAALLEGASPAVVGHQGRPGHPVLLGPEELHALRTGPAPADGLRALLGGARVVEGGPDSLLNLNTPAQWSAWLRGAEPG